LPTPAVTDVPTTKAPTDSVEAPPAEPLGREVLFRLVGPLVGVVMATVLSGATAEFPVQHPRPVVAAAILIAATVASVAFAPWQRLPRRLGLAPPVAFVIVAMLIREAAGGNAGYDLLVLLPVVWAALYTAVGELLVVLGAVAVARLAVLLSSNPPADASTRSLFVVATAAFLGLVVQQVFGQMRTQTAALRTEARRDYLTGVTNRMGWDEEVRRAVRDSADAGQPLSVVVLDLDHFKLFNDRAGHLEGDRLLRQITQAWLGQLRRADLLGRLGGDEFAVLLRDCGVEAAAAVACRLCECIPQETTCSAGVAIWDGREPVDTLLARADEALYRAKADGRDRVEVAPTVLPY
jgi:diguanylate cyclase (GGDEF)-like protein